MFDQEVKVQIQEITTKLRDKRNELGEKNYGIAKKAGIRHMLLKSIEGGGNPTLATLLKICNVLNLKITISDKK